LPPNRTIFLGIRKEGKKINEINIIPTKNKIENIDLLIIITENYIKSL
tara:strand:- start:757 stop:900 length:144 start_codon:yes stop_codon:yes gene_type:complete